MSIGTGIAILGVWLLPVAGILSPYVTGTGVFLLIIVAASLTASLL